MNLKKVFLTSALALLASNSVAAPDEEALGKSKGYPSISFGQWPTEPNKIGSMTNMENAYKSAPVRTSGSQVRALKAHPAPPEIKFFKDRRAQSLDDLLNTERVTGLLLLQDDMVVVEKYQYDRKPEHRFLAYSMAKTVTGILVGAALKDGAIKSLDDTVEQYVTELKGTDYGKVTIRNLLRMSSGIKWIERGTESNDDVGNLVHQTIMQGGSGGYKAVANNRSGREQGTDFNYNSADTFVLTLVVRAATGKTLADYTSEKLWSKIGAESDASWNVDWSGTEVSFGFFNATLRDYGRLALYINEGLKDVVSPEYYAEMTDVKLQPAPGQARAISKYYGYGYQTWLLPYKTPTFAMLGSYGQMIVMQPATGISIVMTRAWKTQRSNLDQFKADISLIHGLLRSLNGDLAVYPVIE